MYSDSISKFFSQHGIKVGDVIKIEAKGIVQEGELMPSTEANDNDIILIKLKNGYNIGVNYKNATISKVKQGEPFGQFPRTPLKYKSGLPKIKLLYNGGTIGSKIDYKTGGVFMLTKPEELLYVVPELSNIAEINAETLSSIASEDMTCDNWINIAKEVAIALNGGFKGVIVTMGTDTMHYASAALSFMLDGLNAPVVVTGAQRSPDRGSSDAFQNLICAAQIASKSDIAEVGICMHSSSSDDNCSFMRGTKVRKMHTSRRDAFRAINSKPIAFVDMKGNIVYNNDYKKVEPHNKKVNALTKFERKVALVKTYAGQDPAIIDFYVQRGYRGIIIEGTGLGHTPLAWLPNVENAIKQGIIVGMTSQCLNGRVNGKVYRTLRLLSNAGVVYCEDMLPEVALVKLGWLLGNYSAKEAKEMLSKNLRGELKNRSIHDEFLV